MTPAEQKARYEEILADLVDEPISDEDLAQAARDIEGVRAFDPELADLLWSSAKSMHDACQHVARKRLS